MNNSVESFDLDSSLEMEGNETSFFEPSELIEPLNCSGCLNELCIAESDYEVYRSWVTVDTFEMILITLNMIVFLAGIIGNSLVFIAVTTTKSMQSVTNIFIVNLAMADILVMLFCAPPSVIWDVTNTWIFGSLMCRVVIYIQDISVSVSVLTLTFIAYDRYYAICRPLQFSSRKTKAAAVIAGIWTISGMIGIPDAVSLRAVSPFTKEDYPCRAELIQFDLSTCKPTWSDNVDFFFTLTKALLLYTLPLIFMSVAYYHIVRTLWRRNNIPGSQETTDGASSGQRLSNSATANSATAISTASTPATPTVSTVISNTRLNSANRTLDNQLRTRRKVAKMLIAVVIMFSINFFPVHFLPIVQYVVDRTLQEGSPAYERAMLYLVNGSIITHCMCYFNSAINPIIYYFMSAQFKAQYRRILSCRCMADTPSPKFGQPLHVAAQKRANAGYALNNHNKRLINQRHAQSCRIPMNMNNLSTSKLAATAAVNGDCSNGRLERPQPMRRTACSISAASPRFRPGPQGGFSPRHYRPILERSRRIEEPIEEHSVCATDPLLNPPTADVHVAPEENGETSKNNIEQCSKNVQVD